jgi:beta-lactamase class A
MALPGPDRLFTGASAIPRGTVVYNKTGSTAHVCGDMGILVVRGRNGGRYPYILVGVIEKERRARNYGSWIKSRGNVIRRVSNLVYQGIAQHHRIRS